MGCCPHSTSLTKESVVPHHRFVVCSILDALKEAAYKQQMRQIRRIQLVSSVHFLQATPHSSQKRLFCHEIHGLEARLTQHI